MGASYCLALASTIDVVPVFYYTQLRRSILVCCCAFQYNRDAQACLLQDKCAMPIVLRRR